MSTSHKRYLRIKKVTLVGVLCNIFLSLAKVIGAIYWHSQALFADGIHSFSDLIIDAMVIFSSKYSHQQADDSHPYGHQRIETAATLFLALILILVGIGLMWDALVHLMTKQWISPDILALVVASISVLVNEGLFYYTHYVGKILASNLLIANAWHHRSDAASSLVVVIGLIGGKLGYIYCDAIAACIVGVLIVKMGVDYGWSSVKELIDTAVSLEDMNRIRDIITSIDGVVKLHQLRSRSMAGDVYVDVHIQVSPDISVSEGHYIAQNVHYALLKANLRIKDVTVHVDPEDDEIYRPSLDLPMRSELEKTLLKPWKKAFSDIASWRLHYLKGKVCIDLILSDASLLQDEVFKERIYGDCRRNPMIEKLVLYVDGGEYFL
jgi:cation diffusion facilitator family transporter